MAEIDTDADIEVHQAEGELVVTIPLVGEVSKQWLSWFMKHLREQDSRAPGSGGSRPDATRRLGANRNRASGGVRHLGQRSRPGCKRPTPPNQALRQRPRPRRPSGTGGIAREADFVMMGV